MYPIWRTISVLALLTLLGVIGYRYIEGWDWADAIYMAVITLTTVGFGEVHQLSPGGRVFTVFYLVLGIGVFLFGIVQVGEIIVRLELRDWLGRRKMDSAIKSMRNHIIVCGFGRFGRRLCEELAERSLPFVVIELDGTVIQPCEELGWPYLVGDATEDDTLVAAGIAHARGLAAALTRDAENLYVVLSARLLRKDLQILSRATTSKDAAKLELAGANRVIALHATAAVKMAQIFVNPNVEDFIEVVTSRGRQLDLAEIQVSADAPYAGRPLAESGFADRGIMIVGIRRASGELLLPPRAADAPAAGDCLIALGQAKAIRDLVS